MPYAADRFAPQPSAADAATSSAANFRFSAARPFPLDGDEAPQSILAGPDAARSFWGSDETPSGEVSPAEPASSYEAIMPVPQAPRYLAPVMVQEYPGPDLGESCAPVAGSPLEVSWGAPGPTSDYFSEVVPADYPPTPEPSFSDSSYPPPTLSSWDAADPLGGSVGHLAVGSVLPVSSVPLVSDEPCSPAGPQTDVLGQEQCAVVSRYWPAETSADLTPSKDSLFVVSGLDQDFQAFPLAAESGFTADSLGPVASREPSVSGEALASTDSAVGSTGFFAPVVGMTGSLPVSQVGQSVAELPTTSFLATLTAAASSTEPALPDFSPVTGSISRVEVPERQLPEGSTQGSFPSTLGFSLPPLEPLTTVPQLHPGGIAAKTAADFPAESAVLPGLTRAEARAAQRAGQGTQRAGVPERTKRSARGGDEAVPSRRPAAESGRRLQSRTAGSGVRSASASGNLASEGGVIESGLTRAAARRARDLGGNPASLSGSIPTGGPVDVLPSRTAARRRASPVQPLILGNRRLIMVAAATAVGLVGLGTGLAKSASSNSASSAVNSLAKSDNSVSESRQLVEASGAPQGLTAGLPDSANSTFRMKAVARSAERGPIGGCAGTAPKSEYGNGQIPSDELCAVPFAQGHKLRGDAAVQLIRLNAAYKAKFGEDLCLTDSYRSLSSQYSLAARKPGLAAKPGTSEHGLGLAIDMCDGPDQVGSTRRSWFLDNAPDYGWENPAWAQPGGSRPEPWHWEFYWGR